MKKLLTTQVLAVGIAASAILVGCDACEDRVRAVIHDDSVERVTPTQMRSEEDQNREVEPNDTASQATPIELRREMGPMLGAIDPADDVDWFALSHEDSEDWIVEITVTPQGSSLDLAVYLEVPGGGDYPPLLYDLGGAGEAESIPMVSVARGEPTRLFVTGDGGTTGEYRIDIRRRRTAAAMAMEPNDHAHVATPLSLPGEIQGFYDRPHDREVFHVAPEAVTDAVYSLEVSHIPEIPQRLRIFDDSTLQDPVLTMEISADRPAVIPNLALPEASDEGLYFVLTAGEQYNRQRGYRLRVIEHPPVQGFVLEREPNDTEGAAQVLNFGDQVRGYLHHRDDRDRFRFVVEGPDEEAEREAEELAAAREMERMARGEAGEEEEPEEEVDPWGDVPEKEAPEVVAQVRVKPLVDAHRLALRWLPAEETGERPLELEAEAEEEGLVLCNHVLGPGEYDLEVRSVETAEGFRSRTFDYELSVENLAELEGLEVEPNDTVEEADRLEIGATRTGFISVDGDVDYFAFLVAGEEAEPGGEEVLDAVEEGVDEVDEEPGWDAEVSRSVRIHLAGNPLNLRFELLDDEGGRVAMVNRSGPGGDEELTIDLPPGLYYLAVSATSGSSCDPYELEVTLP